MHFYIQLSFLVVQREKTKQKQKSSHFQKYIDCESKIFQKILDTIFTVGSLMF